MRPTMTSALLATAAILALLPGQTAANTATCSVGPESLDGTLAIAINATTLDITDPVAIAAFESAFVDAYNDANEFNENLCDPFNRVLTGATLDTTSPAQIRNRRRLQRELDNDMPLLQYVPSFLRGQPRHQVRELKRIANLDMYSFNIYYLKFIGYCRSCSKHQHFYNDVASSSRGTGRGGRNRNRDLTSTTGPCTCPAGVSTIRTPTVKEVIAYMEAAEDEDWNFDNGETIEMEETDCGPDAEADFDKTIEVFMKINEDKDDADVQDIMEECIVEAYNFAAFELCDPEFRHLDDASIVTIADYDVSKNFYDVKFDLEGDCRGCGSDPDLFVNDDDYVRTATTDDYVHYGDDDDYFVDDDTYDDDDDDTFDDDDDYTYDPNWHLDDDSPAADDDDCDDDDWDDDDWGDDDDSTRRTLHSNNKNKNNGEAQRKLNKRKKRNQRKQRALRKQFQGEVARPARHAFNAARSLVVGDVCYCNVNVIDRTWAHRAPTAHEFLEELDNCLWWYDMDILVY